MGTFALYDEKGEIRFVMSSPGASLTVRENGPAAGLSVAPVAKGLDPNLYRIVGGIEFPKPAMACAFDKQQIDADGVEVVTLNNLPDPCTVTYIGPGFREEAEVAGGYAEFTTDAEGKHRVKLSAFPYLDWEGSFDAV